MKCPVICNPGLGTGHSSTVSVRDFTLQIDTTCNNALFLTDDPGYADSSNPTGGQYLFSNKQLGARAQLITSVSDALRHFDADSEVVKTARAIDQNQNNGIQTFFYVGFWDRNNEESVVDALDEIEDCQPCWITFWLTKFDQDGNPVTDTTQNDIASGWAMANDKLFSAASHDTALLNPIDTNNLKARLYTLGYKSTAIEYITAQCRTLIGADGYPILDSNGEEQIESWYPYREAMLAMYLANVDFESTGSPYTWAYKPEGVGNGWVGIPVDVLGGGEKVNITGVYPDGRLNPANNGYANVYVKDFGNPGEWSGRTVTGHWIDEQHLLIWLKKRLRQAIANVMKNNRSIPYDDKRGRALLINTVADVLTTVYNAGWFNQDGGAFSDYNRSGPGASGWGIRTESYQSVTAERRSSRVAPPMEICFIPAGSTHVLPIYLCALADPTPFFSDE